MAIETSTTNPDRWKATGTCQNCNERPATGMWGGDCQLCALRMGPRFWCELCTLRARLKHQLEARERANMTIPQLETRIKRLEA